MVRTAWRADRAANRGNPKGRMIVGAFRAAQWAEARPRWFSVPANTVYRAVSEGLFGAELPPSVVAGPGLQVWHGTGLVVHSGTRIGSDVVLRHNTTIGTADDRADSRPPVIGDRVEIGAGAILIGSITVGDDAVIGAGAVVVDNVPTGATVVGNPARVVTHADSS